MKVKIPYDGADVELNCPGGASVLETKKLPVISDRIVRDKILAELKPRFEFVQGFKIGVVVNDATRRLPTPMILKILAEFLPLSQTSILIATGTHRAPTSAELDIILGDTRQAFEGNVVVHDCYDASAHIAIGTTSRGTPVEINRALLDCDKIITINSVEPHFFAGFTGGRKSIIPGLASFETIVSNHYLAKEEEARSLSLDNNPLHLDLEEAVSLIDKNRIHSIQLVTSHSGKVIDLYCGDLDSSFKSACRKARDAFTVDIENKYEIVLAIGEPPLDINLYQLQKGQEHGAEAVAQGGILIVVGACNEGIGSDYFVNLADLYPTPDSALAAKPLKDNRFGIHKLIKTARHLKRMKIWYVTKVDDKSVRKVYFEPRSSVQSALDKALQELGSNARVAILRDACFIVPTLRHLKEEIDEKES